MSLLDRASLNAFCCELETDIQAFRAYWTAANMADPDKFPSELGLGDWDEQFKLWQEGHA